MGAAYSCTSKGSLLLVAAANGDLVSAQELLAKYPKSAAYYNFKDRSSPLLQAAARGHFELVQLILETAVMTEGPERAKKNCIDHANSKRQTALMVACKHGHPDCVEYLVTNGGDPLLVDERRHNTCLHFAALYGHSECVHKLLGSRAAYRVQGRQVPVAQIPCVEDGQTMKFIDRHNGWGLSALHIAVFQGSVSTVRALLRHGADIESAISASKVENSPIRCAVGSNALHIAALTGNIIMAKLILETQESYPGLELRSRTNAAGLKPHDYAQSARNPVLMHLLDERLPVTLLRQIWMNYSLEQSLPPRHQTLGSMLQKLKLMFNLELIAIQRNLALLQQQQQAASEGEGGAAATTAATAAPGGASAAASAATGVTQLQLLSPSGGVRQLTMGHGRHHGSPEPAGARLLWLRRQEEMTQLLNTVSQLHDHLKQLCRRDEHPGESPEGGASRADRASTYEAVLDFILSTLITPRTVSAILHAAKKLVSASVNGSAAAAASASGAAVPEPPPQGDSDSQHGLALLSTALRAVETCLQAAVYLTSPGALDQEAAAVSAAGASGAARGAGGAEGGAPAAHTQPADAAQAAAGTDAGSAANAAAAGQDGGSNGPTLVGTPSPSPEATQIGSRTLPMESAAGAPAAGALPRLHGNIAALLAEPPAAAPGDATAGAANSQRSALVPVQVLGMARGAGTGALGLGPAGAGHSGLLLPTSRGGLDLPSHSAFATHWSAHLHTLIAQLQWDIGVQRHRRRRAHAAAAAARTAAAAAAVVAATGTANGSTAATAAPATAVPTAIVVTPAAAAAAMNASSTQAANTVGTEELIQANIARMGSSGGTPATAASADPSGPTPATLLRVLSSRRGDAVQDVVTTSITSGGNGANGSNTTLPTIRGGASGTDSDASTPHIAASAAAASATGSTTATAGAAAQPLHRSEGSASAAAPSAADDLASHAAAEPAAEAGGSSLLYNSPGAGGNAMDEIIPLPPSTHLPVDALGGADGGPLGDEELSTRPDSSPPPRAGRGVTVNAMEDFDRSSLAGDAPKPAPGGSPAAAAAAAAAAPSGRKESGKESRDGAAGGGDGGLDGHDDSPAASESGSDWSDDDRNVCSICMDLPVAVLVAGCQHGLCVQCAFQLCVKGRELPCCPFCRQKIGGFEAKAVIPVAPVGQPPAAAGQGAAGLAVGGPGAAVATPS